MNALLFEGSEQWTDKAAVPENVLSEFSKPDGKTSFWDDGYDGSFRACILIALLLQRQSIGPMTVAPLWRSELQASTASKLAHTRGDTPHVPARERHFELQHPVEDDYRGFAIAIRKRNEIASISAPQSRDIIEDAYFGCGIDLDAIKPNLRDEIRDLISKRHIEPKELAAAEAVVILDICKNRKTKIPSAIKVSSETLLNDIQQRRIAKKTRIVICCENGHLSRAAAKQVRANDFRAVQTLVGGYAAWESAGLPLVVEAAAAD